MTVLYFESPFGLKFDHFCVIKRAYELTIAYKVHDCYCSICLPTQTIDFWNYNTSNAKLDSKLTILCFGPIFDLTVGTFCTIKMFITPTHDFQSIRCALFYLLTYLGNRFMYLHHTKYKIEFIIHDFMLRHFLHYVWPFLQ